MKKIPVTIVDNFYENPDLVRHFAMSQEFYPNQDGKWPGSRSNQLFQMNENLNQTFCEKLFSLFFDLNQTHLNWRIESCFQLVSRFSNVKTSAFNVGWIHSDPCIFSGVIYLNPNPFPNTGTSVFKLKNEEVDDCNQKTKFIYYSGQEISEQEYEKDIMYNNNKFVESVRVENVYNRLILFEGGVYHGVPSFYTEDDEPRLTQVFFVKELDSTKSLFPIERSRLSF